MNTQNLYHIYLAEFERNRSNTLGALLTDEHEYKKTISGFSRNAPKKESDPN